MSTIGRFLSPFRVSLTSIQSSSPSLLLSKNPISVRNGPLKAWAKNLVPTMQVRTSRLQPNFTIRRTCLHKLSLSVRNICVGSLLGMSVVAGSMYLSTSIAYAMVGIEHDPLVEKYSDSGDPSGFLKDDFDTFWALARKFQLPAVLVMTLFLGWRHPITLVINVALLLFCTRPSPFSVYVFIEQLRRRALRQDQGLFNSKLLFARRVEVQDYKLLCLAKVELRDMKLSLIGILGGWWVLQSSRI